MNTNKKTKTPRSHWWICPRNSQLKLTLSAWITYTLSKIFYDHKLLLTSSSANIKLIKANRLITCKFYSCHQISELWTDESGSCVGRVQMQPKSFFAANRADFNDVVERARTRRSKSTAHEKWHKSWLSLFSSLFLLSDINEKLKISSLFTLFLVACYATLHPALSIGRLVGWLVCHTLLFLFVLFLLTPF